MLKPIAVIIARFQTPYLHQGHIQLINKVKEKHNKLIIFLGCSPVKGSQKNPLDYFVREQMIKSVYPENVFVFPLNDQPNDIFWSKKLDQELTDKFPSETFILYGSRDSFIPHYSGKYKTEELPPVIDINATEIRNKISDKVINTEEFRSGIIYAFGNLYPKVYPTVDIAIFKIAKTFILLGKKPNETTWRLPGGFTDPTDSNFETAARRELKEECGDIEVSEMTYEASYKVDDWRYRSEVDKIITTLFSADFVNGTPKAGDDLELVDWFPVDSLSKMIADNKINATHIPLIRILFNKYSQIF